LSSMWFYYLSGVAEDAYIDVNPRKGYLFELETKCSEWATLLTHVVKIIDPRIDISVTNHRGYTRIRFWRKQLVTKIKDIKENPKQMLNTSLSEKIYWIKGVFDAEGTITLTGSNQLMISIYNNGEELIETLSQILEKELRIKTHTYKPLKRKTIQLYITGKQNTSHFLEKIKPLNPCKNPPAHDTRSQTESSRARAPIDPAVCYIDVGSSHPGGAVAPKGGAKG